jgi:hypothetical protein
MKAISLIVTAALAGLPAGVEPDAGRAPCRARAAVAALPATRTLPVAHEGAGDAAPAGFPRPRRRPVEI